MIHIHHESFLRFCFPRGDGDQVHPAMQPLTEHQEKIYNLARRGWEVKTIADRMGITPAQVYDALVKIRHHGYQL